MAMKQNSLVIDLSHWNAVTDWHAIARSGVLGVIHKFSQGTNYRDPMFEAARAGCKSAGLMFGRYHFAEGSDVKSQVKNFLANLEDDELLALDWETNTNSSGTMTLSQAVAFVQDVEAHVGHYPVLYSGNVAKEALKAGPNPTLARCHLWLAHYANQPVCPPGWSEPWLWQWTDKGTCPGIVGAVDQDAYQNSPDDLRSEWTGDRKPAVPARPEQPAQPDASCDTITITVPAGSRVLIHTTGDPGNVIASG